MNEHAAKYFLGWLQERIDKINALEERGRGATAKGDQADYISAMREKAELLADLSEDAGPYLDESGEALDYARRGLETFSRNADQALDLGSVFYMSALLFPEDHQAGEMHNLELFRDELARRLGL